MSTKRCCKKAKITHLKSKGMEPVTLDAFTHFFLSRAYDIISEGRYKKHFISGKDLGDTWAISMQASIVSVVNRVKGITTLIKNTDEFTCKNLRMVCYEVISSQLPPNGIYTEAGTCAITKVLPSPLPPSRRSGSNLNVSQSRSNVCISLNGNTKATSSTGHLLIHPTLLHFFTMVWFVHKLEHVIRNYTRWWLEQRTTTGENIEQLCTEFSLNQDLIENMYTIFNHALSHIQLSIDTYQEQ
jgi:hypothetical protein